jgi:class 3 adenylate cyclase/predicted ATPase
LAIRATIGREPRALVDMVTSGSDDDRNGSERLTNSYVGGTVVNVANWLRSLGLEEYEATFRKNAVTSDLIANLTADDLRDLGIAAVGHRRRLLDAIAKLRIELNRDSNNADPRDSPANDVPQPTPQRRQVSVMFCDMADSTQLSTRLDPEDLSAVIRRYQSFVAGTIGRFDGFISRYVGDGVLIYFGYPNAHEDDAERAVRAALAIIAEIDRVRISNERVRVRIGIATGLVIVGQQIGTGESHQQTAIGETPNLAARLQAVARPNTVVIAASTRRLVGDLFDYRDLGTMPMKGIAAPVPVWEVLRPSVVESRFEALHPAALSPLVGRDEEIGLLLRRWARARTGDGHVMLISGEAGVGKSRIVVELNKHLGAESAVQLRYYCSPYHQDSALFPVIDQIGRAAAFAREDSPPVRLKKLEAMLARSVPSDEHVAFLADLLSLPASERHPLPALSPQQKKEETLNALILQLETLAQERPVLMVVEDAHWSDPTSRELLDLVVERVCSLPVLLIVTFRPEFQPRWIGQPQVTLLALNRLNRRDRIVLVDQIAGGKTLPEAIVSQIVDRTDGVPLFVEELTKSVLESGLLREEADRYVLDRLLPPMAIPTSLQDSLMARLDRLGPVRLVAQVGAAIGREFPYALLRTVSGLADSELEAALTRLVASELVFQRGTLPHAVYVFKHALVHDAAHDSLLRDARQQLHAQIAKALEADSPEIMGSQPEFFAQHYAEAGLPEKSAEYWGQAGRRSATRSAMAEAASQFQKGLDQLTLLPNDRQKLEKELELCCALGAALRYTKGQATPEMGQAFARARELWEQLGSPAEFLYVLYGQSRYHIYRGEYEEAQRLDQDLLRLSRQYNDSKGLVLGHDSAGRDLLLLGRFNSARPHLEAVLTLYDPLMHRSLVHQTGCHSHIVSREYLAIVLFCLGFPNQAWAQSREGVAEALRLAHPPSLAVGLATCCRLLSLTDNYSALDDRAAQLIAVATEHGFPLYRGLGTMYRGWGKVRTGDLAEGMSMLRAGSTVFSATGAKTRTSYHNALVAKAFEIAGQIMEAVCLLDDALQSAVAVGERWFVAEMYRHKGELMFRQSEFKAAENFYRQALVIAREQGARLWELRAAISLGELMLDQRRRMEANELLVPAYRWFTEGFDTQDLVRARSLLAELG